MIDKPKTNIEELLKTPRNGKYLKVVAREDFLPNNLRMFHPNFITISIFSDGEILEAGIPVAREEVWSGADILADDHRQLVLQE